MLFSGAGCSGWAEEEGEAGEEALLCGGTDVAGWDEAVSPLLCDGRFCSAEGGFVPVEEAGFPDTAPDVPGGLSADEVDVPGCGSKSVSM